MCVFNSQSTLLLLAASSVDDGKKKKLAEELVAAMDKHFTDGAKEGLVTPWEIIAVSNTLKAFIAVGSGDIDASSAWLDKSLAALEV